MKTRTMNRMAGILAGLGAISAAYTTVTAPFIWLGLLSLGVVVIGIILILMIVLNMAQS